MSQIYIWTVVISVIVLDHIHITITTDDRGLQSALSAGGVRDMSLVSPKAAVGVRDVSLEAARDILPRDVFDIVRTYTVDTFAVRTEFCIDCGETSTHQRVDYIGERPALLWGDSPPPREWLEIKRELEIPMRILCWWCVTFPPSFKRLCSRCTALITSRFYNRPCHLCHECYSRARAINA